MLIPLLLFQSCIKTMEESEVKAKPFGSLYRQLEDNRLTHYASLDISVQIC